MQSTDTGGEDRAEPGGIDADRVDSARLFERFSGSSDGELLDSVGAARLLGVVEVGGGIPVVDRERLSARDTGTEQSVPERRAPDAGGGDDAETRDRDPTAASGHSFATTMS